MKKIMTTLTSLLSKVKAIFLLGIMICFTSSCQSPKGNKLQVEERQDSCLVERSDSRIAGCLDTLMLDYLDHLNEYGNIILDSNQVIIDDFFIDFQEKNDGWTKTEQGHKKLVAAFKKKMTTDIEFAKACASFNSSEYNKSIVDLKSKGVYEKADGEEGELVAFDYVIVMPLIKPLYNGDETIFVKYEIISAIPSTVELHLIPYIENVNYCSTATPFLQNLYDDGILNLGSYILTNKQ